MARLRYFVPCAIFNCHLSPEQVTDSVAATPGNCIVLRQIDANHLILRWRLADGTIVSPSIVFDDFCITSGQRTVPFRRVGPSDLSRRISPEVLARNRFVSRAFQMYSDELATMCEKMSAGMEMTETTQS